MLLRSSLYIPSELILPSCSALWKADRPVTSSWIPTETLRGSQRAFVFKELCSWFVSFVVERLNSGPMETKPAPRTTLLRPRAMKSHFRCPPICYPWQVCHCSYPFAFIYLLLLLLLLLLFSFCIYWLVSGLKPGNDSPQEPGKTASIAQPPQTSAPLSMSAYIVQWTWFSGLGLESNGHWSLVLILFVIAWLREFR